MSSIAAVRSYSRHRLREHAECIVMSAHLEDCVTTANASRKDFHNLPACKILAQDGAIETSEGSGGMELLGFVCAAISQGLYGHGHDLIQSRLLASCAPGLEQEAGTEESRTLRTLTVLRQSPFRNSFSFDERNSLSTSRSRRLDQKSAMSLLGPASCSRSVP